MDWTPPGFETLDRTPENAHRYPKSPISIQNLKLDLCPDLGKFYPDARYGIPGVQFSIFLY